MDIFSGTRFEGLMGSEPATKNGNHRGLAASDGSATSPAPVKQSSRGRTFLIIWLVAGLMSVSLPVLARNTRMNRYQNNTLKNLLDQVNKAWNNVQGNQQGNQQMQQGQYYGGQQMEGEEQGSQDEERNQGRQFYDISKCKWYQFNCESVFVDETGTVVSAYEMEQEMYSQQMEQQQQEYEQQQEYQKQQQEYQEEQYKQQQEAYQQQQEYQQQQYQQQQEQYQQQQVAAAYGQYGQYGQYQAGGAYGQYYEGQPEWYSNFGQSEEARNQALEWGKPSGYLRFVYVWQLVMFVGILTYGANIIVTGKSPSFLIGMLMIWFQMSLLSMFMLSDGSIVTSDNVMQRTGFYGQFAVLMFMTNAWYAAFGLLFLIIFSIRASIEEETPEAEETKTASLNVGDDYVKVV